MTDERFEPTPRTKVRRFPDLASYEKEVIRAILDEGHVCHVGIVTDGQPFVLPMAYARLGDALLLHGSTASRVVRALADGAPACVTVTIVDGVVLARASFNHTLNYRSVMAIGSARPIDDAARKRTALDALVDHQIPGRRPDARGPNEREMKATRIVEFPLVEVSAKVRAGPPKDDPEDVGLPVWAGVIPLAWRALPPVDAPDLPGGIAPPRYVTEYSRRRP